MPTVRPRTTIYLWEFLLQLLDGEENCSAISWVNRERGEFVLKDQSEIAKLWGRVKGRPRMDKIKLGRAMRYYYKKKLLAKVPRRKAVYRFTKFDHLKDKESRIVRHEDFPEIDFGDSAVLDVIGDDKSERDSTLPADIDGNQDDTPLESLLAAKIESDYQRSKSPELRAADANYNTYENSSKNSDYLNSYYDYTPTPHEVPRAYETYYTCADNTSCSQFECENYLTCRKAENFRLTSENLSSQNSYTTQDINNNYVQYNGETGGPLATLLLNSILMSDQQVLHDSTAGFRENNHVLRSSCSFQTGNVTPEAVISPTAIPIKNENTTNNTAQFQDIDTESTWNTLKELERLLMINRSF